MERKYLGSDAEMESLNRTEYNPPEGLQLKEEEQGLNLSDGKMSLRVDFTNSLKRIKKENPAGEMLVRASRVKALPMPIHVVDATAGLGEDSFVLAAAGFEVDLYERDPVIAALLADGLARAEEDPDLAEIVSRMHFHEADSIAAMKGMNSPDVILLDPMFPARAKSGLVKKKFQLLGQLERPCADEEELLAAAMAAAPKRIVIKRPEKGPYLGGRKPSYSLNGKSIRYDVIVL